MATSIIATIILLTSLKTFNYNAYFRKKKSKYFRGLKGRNKGWKQSITNAALADLKLTLFLP